MDRARAQWIGRLMDLSRRNNLLYFQDLRTGTLDVTASIPESLEALWTGKPVSIRDLLPQADPVNTAARLQEIRRRALLNQEEKGLETLFLAMGMATWTPADGGRPPQSAVLLIPITVEPKGRGGQTFALRRSGDLHVNPVLLHALATEFNCHLEADVLLDPTETDSNHKVPDCKALYARFSAAASEIPGFQILERAVLGNFSFHKMAMVKELQDLGEAMLQHDLVSSIAGDPTARLAVAGRRKDLDPRELDQVHPDQEYLILDADSSQQRVIASVLAAQNGVIQGPPGTGKSQTIANVIAALVASGRRVLFVAEKRAALEVVHSRLQRAGLGHLVLDLHGADVSRRSIIAQLAESLDAIHETAPVHAEVLHHQMMDRRNQLNDHVERMHRNRSLSDMSVYQLQGLLLRLPAAAQAATRWRGRSLQRLDQESVAAIRQLLRDAQGLAPLFLSSHSSPWAGAPLKDGVAVQKAIDLVLRLDRELWPLLQDQLATLAANTDIRIPGNLEETRILANLLASITQTFERYGKDIFHQELEGWATALAPARTAFSAFWASIARPSYRGAVRQVRSLCADRAATPHQLLQDLSMAMEQRHRWQQMSPSRSEPLLPFPDLRGSLSILGELLTTVDQLASLLGDPLPTLPLPDLAERLRALSADLGTAYQVPQRFAIEEDLQKRGAGSLLQELRNRSIPPGLWQDLFQHAWLSSWLEQVMAEDASLAGFEGRRHEELQAEFCHLDRERIHLTAARVRRVHAEHVINRMNAFPEQRLLVQRETTKKSRHKPLRQLLREAPDVLTALRPCWMASPLSVSQLISGDQQYFDVVVFDEASQVPPEEAIPALLRGAQAVVAGDRHQLPPTTFFASSEDEEEGDADSTLAYESLLDLLSSFLPAWPLEWHYRSRDESLIAFSNHHIYRDGMVTFPGPGGAYAVTHVPVPALPGQDGQEVSSSPEVERVIQLILQHVEERPEESLGVITMGIRHAQRIEGALDAVRRERHDLDAYLEGTTTERFFIKNLERVQGDERDAIILSIGYGKDRSGRLPFRFGPLLSDGGERRLNVAITRARYHMTVVSSFTHQDMDPGRCKAKGVELLRRFLEYASSNGRIHGDPGQQDEPLNPFEEDVFATLMNKGILLVPQWGASRYRIDFVAQHPERPGQFVLAIECDGATYHSAPTARDRDRLRQQHLESLGWRFLRIWSTDWFWRKEQEVERVLRAYQEAVSATDRADIPADPPITSVGHTPANSIGLVSPESPPTRIPRPPIPIRTNSGQYAESGLDSLVCWIQSDGYLRTDEEILAELRQILGIPRMGVRIEKTLRDAIHRTRESWERMVP